MADFTGIVLILTILVLAAVGGNYLTDSNIKNLDGWNCTQGYYADVEPPYTRYYTCTQYTQASGKE